MKKIMLSILSVLALTSTSFAQPAEQKEVTQFMQITTVESVVGGGLGRSKMIITKADGNQEEKEINNLFSLGGINFKNIKENESAILKTLKQYGDEGWKLIQTIPLTLSPGDNGSGIFMTRYLLSKSEEKKGF